jgi:peptidoglycan/xylan/chitin deacetylase (PgdA/CDA1 family)
MNKPVLKNFLLFFPTFLFLALLSFSAFGGQANIFVYHRFGDNRYPSTNISLQDFEAHLNILQREKVEVLKLDDVVLRLRQGLPLPTACAVLTIDDGYRSFLSGAMPLLRRYGFPATLFVSTGLVGREGYLSWEELRQLSREGIDIGSHSATHFHLVEKKAGEAVSEWLQRVEHDIVSGQESFRKNLGEPPHLFSYPYGEYTPEVSALIESLGFIGAVGQQSGVVSEISELFVLPRFPMGGAYASEESFSTKLRMKALPVKVLHPRTTLLEEENPPVLKVKIDDKDVDLRRLSCFVSGQGNCLIRTEPSTMNTFFVQGAEPLMSRRSKYTLTAPSKDGKSWYWFSRLWINVGIRE